MGDEARIGLRYCGGCNPRYDRVAVAKKLMGFFPDLTFYPAEAGVPYTAVLVICGCSSRCARVEDLSVPSRALLYLSGWEDLLPVKKTLEQLLEERTAKKVLTLTHEEVLEILPHREPMLFIDEVSSLSPGEEITASYHVRPDLPAFGGHFPGEPVLPGIYAVEAGAQAADLLLLSLERYEGKIPLFMGIRRANFRKKILPGDRLTIHASLKEERAELGFALCRAQILVEQEVCADMELSLALRSSPSP